MAPRWLQGVSFILNMLANYSLRRSGMVRVEAGVDYDEEGMALYEVVANVRHGYRLLICAGSLERCKKIARRMGIDKVCWIMPSVRTVCRGHLRGRINCCLVGSGYTGQDGGGGGDA